jgi:hypothetical protein
MIILKSIRGEYKKFLKSTYSHSTTINKSIPHFLRGCTYVYKGCCTNVYNGDNMKQYLSLPSHTINKIKLAKPDNVRLEEFVEFMVENYLGTDCEHKHQLLCLILPVNVLGYLDVGKAHELIESINIGRKPNCLVRVCPDCLRLKRIFK